jgi:hypothetical protein
MALGVDVFWHQGLPLSTRSEGLERAGPKSELRKRQQAAGVQGTTDLASTEASET